MPSELRIGTAGWSIPKQHAAAFPGTGVHIERYARQLHAVEINSSFYRPHKPATYARWAASVPPEFRFAVKLPREITHERRLADVTAPLERLLGDQRAVEDYRERARERAKLYSWDAVTTAYERLLEEVSRVRV